MSVSVDQNNLEFTNALYLMEDTDSNLFITGEAGTGKSTLLKFFVANSRKNVAVLAPTGLAAINAGGQTIHKFCQFPPRMMTSESIQEVKIPAQKQILKHLQTLVIDEISMVRADMFDGIDLFLRLNRRINLPFGGVQLILMGDLMQLPPILNSEERVAFGQRYNSPYFFGSQVFPQMQFKYIRLEKNYRQKGDLEFLELLQSVKQGQITPPVLSKLNSRYEADNDNISGLSIHLSTTNQIAAELNHTRLNNIAGKSFDFEAEISGQFNERDCPAESELRLKKGAQVMFIRNDPQGRWVNGTIGKISLVNDFKVMVELEGGEVYEVEPVRWEAIKYEYDEEQEKVVPKVVGWMEQFPLKLAWGVTIHKSQGQTFQKVIIDLGRGSFAHGQTYVALSRCTSLAGISLKRPLEKRDFILDRQVLQFLNQIVWNEDVVYE
ncbi:MAG: hypothetical protein OHK0017_13300 [Patescibacteria group bacterium]